MCGIAGIVSKGKIDERVIGAMVDALSHRGPDARGAILSEDETIFLGHTRLSIIDLDARANQPFFSRDGRYVIVFNGEIYNYQQIARQLKAQTGINFRSTSDTEVIVEGFAHWGIAVLDRMEGMFALAIADLKTSNVYFFRDRIGKKPLYYFCSPELFVFASELKSLLQHPAVRQQKKVNKGVINQFLHLGYIPEPNTIFENIYKFPAGHWGELNRLLQLELKPYWKVGAFGGFDREKNSNRALEELQRRLDDAVKNRLVSDVPLGAFLSGGTDSSLITAIASEHVYGKLKTFSIGFKESKFDESRYASQVAEHLKTEHTEYMLSEKEAVGILETYLHHFDEPFADTSAIPTMLVSKLARKEVTVALTGDGGDELFQGYGAYTWANRLDTLRWKILKTPLEKILKASNNSRWLRISRLLENVPPHELRSHIFSQEQYFFTQSEIRDKLLISKDQIKPFLYDDSYPKDKALMAAERQAIFDLQYYLKDDLLVKVDRASMFHALECRCPLLDHHVVEYSFQVDYSLKVKDRQPKWLLKQLLRRYLPSHLVDRPKWGFSVPLQKWLLTDLRYLIDEHLSDQSVQEVGLFQGEFVRALKDSFYKGQDYLYNRIWLLIAIQKWMKENG